MKWSTWEFKFGIILILISAVFFKIKLMIFGLPDETYDYVLNGLVFLPINILIVTLVLNQLLLMYSNKEKMEKLNMVIGAFFSEVGTKLLTYLSDFDPDLEKISSNLIVTNAWSNKEFDRMNKELLRYNYTVDTSKIDFISLRHFLTQRRSFLIRLLENPILLEHVTFTELLRAVFHLTEELESRHNFVDLPATDISHLAGDIQRVYAILVVQWLEYMNYLKKNYPYLFSLAMRKNPFDEKASPIVR